MVTSIGKMDPRFQALEGGHNLRSPLFPADEPDSIELCESAEDVVSTLQQIVDSGRGPTIRSGGHCYEDFVSNNPGGAILDLSFLSSAAHAV